MSQRAFQKQSLFSVQVALSQKMSTVAAINSTSPPAEKVIQVVCTVMIYIRDKTHVK